MNRLRYSRLRVQVRPSLFWCSVIKQAGKKETPALENPLWKDTKLNTATAATTNTWPQCNSLLKEVGPNYSPTAPISALNKLKKVLPVHREDHSLLSSVLIHSQLPWPMRRPRHYKYPQHHTCHYYASTHLLR
jgi:hypothetical protein